MDGDLVGQVYRITDLFLPVRLGRAFDDLPGDDADPAQTEDKILIGVRGLLRSLRGGLGVRSLRRILSGGRAGQQEACEQQSGSLNSTRSHGPPLLRINPLPR